MLIYFVFSIIFCDNKKEVEDITMEIAMIVLLGVTCLLLVFLCVIVIKNKKQKDSGLSKEQIEANQEIKLRITNLKEELSSSFHLDISKEIINLKNEFNQQNQNSSKTLTDFEREIKKQVEDKFLTLNETLLRRLNEINQKVDESLKGGFKSTSETYEKLITQMTMIEQAKKNIESLSTEVVSLKNVLENNQQRGRFGELALERILYSVFGDTKNVYAVQYVLKNNERPDAVIFLPEPNKMLCIDSKFPFADFRGVLEGDSKEQREQSKKGFSMALKKHITAVKSKYIIPGTTAPQAFLFIPSDAIFAYVHGEMPEAVDYARESNVVLTSPSTLQPILATTQLIRIQYERNKNIDTILKQLQKLGNDFRIFGDDWEKFSQNVDRLEKSKNDMDRKVQTIHKKFNSISDMSEYQEEKKEEITA